MTTAVDFRGGDLRVRLQSEKGHTQVILETGQGNVHLVFTPDQFLSVLGTLKMQAEDAGLLAGGQ